MHNCIHLHMLQQQPHLTGDDKILKQSSETITSTLCYKFWLPWIEILPRACFWYQREGLGFFTFWVGDVTGSDQRMYVVAMNLSMFLFPFIKGPAFDINLGARLFYLCVGDVTDSDQCMYMVAIDLRMFLFSFIKGPAFYTKERGSSLLPLCRWRYRQRSTYVCGID